MYSSAITNFSALTDPFRVFILWITCMLINNMMLRIRVSTTCLKGIQTYITCYSILVLFSYGLLFLFCCEVLFFHFLTLFWVTYIHNFILPWTQLRPCFNSCTVVRWFPYSVVIFFSSLYQICILKLLCCGIFYFVYFFYKFLTQLS